VKFLLRFLPVLCVFGAAAWADEFSGKSPDGKLSFGSKNEKEFYLWATDKPDKKTLIFKEETVFIQAAAISPDNVWIALEQGGASLGHTVLFFKREKGLNFKQIDPTFKGPDPAERVGTFALQTKGIKENILDHSYLHPVKWLDNSMWLIVSLGGKGSFHGTHVQITDWRCRYNPVSHEVAPMKENPGKIEISGGAGQ